MLTEGGYRLLANFLTLAGLPAPVGLPTLDDERAPPTLEQSLPDVPITF